MMELSIIKSYKVYKPESAQFTSTAHCKHQLVSSTLRPILNCSSIKNNNIINMDQNQLLVMQLNFFLAKKALVAPVPFSNHYRRFRHFRGPEADDDEEMRQEELDEEAETDSDTEMGDYDTGDEIEGDDRVPPGIWELHGDQLVRIDQCGTDIELIMEIFPGLWSLDGDRLVPTDAEDFLTRYFMHLIESDADFLSELRPFPLPDLENMGSIEQLLENLDLDQHALVRDFFIDLWDNFRGLIAHRHNFRFPDVERDLDSLSDDHPVVQILDAANTEWRQELLMKFGKPERRPTKRHKLTPRPSDRTFNEHTQRRSSTCSPVLYLYDRVLVRVPGCYTDMSPHPSLPQELLGFEITLTVLFAGPKYNLKRGHNMRVRQVITTHLCASGIKRHVP
ncbi:hypothetical protein PSTT_03732 [Puccinia striiformis]|uniref:Uncharacterized protein n=1 Tax=Puccinia striiformis TaxID=27350 RepID=A0A2S4VVE1_9BASI|nr:hypothetical protein PSTT_03732 [Puccinia striiformis]